MGISNPRLPNDSQRHARRVGRSQRLRTFLLGTSPGGRWTKPVAVEFFCWEAGVEAERRHFDEVNVSKSSENRAHDDSIDRGDCVG
jgi:hypothetical protein